MFIGFKPFRVSLGWQQFTGIQSFPAVAGALAQLVQIDMEAAEQAILTLLTQPSIARAMGAALHSGPVQCLRPRRSWMHTKCCF